MRTLAACLSFLLTLQASLALAAEPRLVRVAVGFDAYPSLPLGSLLGDRFGRDALRADVAIEKKDLIDVDLLERRLQVRGKAVGETRVTISGIDAKKYEFRVQVLETLDEPERKEIVVRAGESTLFEMPREMADYAEEKGVTVPLVAVTRVAPLDFDVISPSHLYLGPRQPGVTGLALLSPRDKLFLYRVKVVAADDPGPPRAEPDDRISLALGECRTISCPKKAAEALADPRIRVRFFAPLREVVSGMNVDGKELILSGHQPGECDLILTDCTQILHRFRVTVRKDGVAAQRGDKEGIADLRTLRSSVKVPVGKTEELSLDEGPAWAVVGQRDPETARFTDDDKWIPWGDIQPVLPKIVRLSNVDKKLSIAGAERGVTDVVLSVDGKVRRIVRVEVE